MRGLLRSFLVSCWFVFLTFPIVVIHVSPLNGELSWRWKNALMIGVGSFFLSFIWRILLVKKHTITAEQADLKWLFSLLEGKKTGPFMKAILLIIAGNIPFLLYIINVGSVKYFSLLAILDAGAVASLVIAHLGAFAGLAVLGIRRSRLIEHLQGFSRSLVQSPKKQKQGLLVVFIILLCLPYFIDMYQISIFTSTLIWVMLGLGLNIVVGQAGMLVLGYVAFYAVGAYVYAIGNQYFGNEYIGFWVFLPIGAVCAMLAGALLSLPVLRLRGDYLAIVTLGFGEIVRVILEGGVLTLEPLFSLLPDSVLAFVPSVLLGSINLGGPAGISGIPAPSFFSLPLSLDNSMRFVYYISLLLVVFTIFVVARLRNSRLGRSWAALREDEIACEAMGISLFKTKLIAFVLGASWAGLGGVLFAAKTGFINPSSFTFIESALILSVVVLGGLDSIIGVVVGACILILLPEYLRALSDYRMLIFGACMVLMMVFRPQGLIPAKTQRYEVSPEIKDALSKSNR